MACATGNLVLAAMVTWLALIIVMVLGYVKDRVRAAATSTD